MTHAPSIAVNAMIKTIPFVHEHEHRVLQFRKQKTINQRSKWKPETQRMSKRSMMRATLRRRTSKMRSQIGILQHDAIRGNGRAAAKGGGADPIAHGEWH